MAKQKAAVRQGLSPAVPATQTQQPQQQKQQESTSVLSLALEFSDQVVDSGVGLILGSLAWLFAGGLERLVLRSSMLLDAWMRMCKWLFVAAVVSSVLAALMSRWLSSLKSRR